MIPDLVARADAQVGELIENITRRHHVRRLSRIGWDRAYRAEGGGWASQSSLREGNQVQVYIDGASALPAIAAAVRLAKSFVHIAGWTISPDFAMEHDPSNVTVRDLLTEAANRVEVRVLVWAGAPVPIVHPTRSDARGSLDRLLHGTSIRGALDKRNRPTHCHHEKLVIIDGTVAFVGGIDLTDVDGDRFDSAPHSGPQRLGWHDAAAYLTGPAVADVAAHFAMRWEATTGERLVPVPVPEPTGKSRVQIVRTVPENTYQALPDGDFGLLEALIGALRRSRQLVYLENQFLWSTELVAVLREKLLKPPTDEFRLCMVLPQRANSGRDDTRGQLSVLKEADTHHRLLVGTIGPPGGERPPVYVHAKVGVVDDDWLTVGSANLNERSLFNDTEVNLITDDAPLARSVRERLWSEHLGLDCTGRDPLEVIETEWRAALATTSTPTRALRPLPSVSRRSSRLLGPLRGLVVDG